MSPVPIPTAEDRRYRTHAAMRREHELAVRQHLSDVLGATLAVLRDDTELCERVSWRLWNEGIRDVSPLGNTLLVRDAAELMLREPGKIVL